MKIISLLSVMLLALQASAEHWPTGFYSSIDSADAYYYDDENRWYCHIQNATQSALYDVESQVRVVGDVWSILSLGFNLGECRWPDGFYTITDGDGAIYRLYPGNICQITSPQMLAAYGGTDSVISAEVNSTFGAGRTWIGQCYWPSYDATQGK